MLALLALGVFWFALFRELSGEWQINPQYNYGYAVPLLTVALFWRRWLERPLAQALSGAIWPGLTGAGLLLLLLPLRVVLEANP